MVRVLGCVHGGFQKSRGARKRWDNLSQSKFRKSWQRKQRMNRSEPLCGRCERLTKHSRPFRNTNFSVLPEIERHLASDRLDGHQWLAATNSSVPKKSWFFPNHPHQCLFWPGSHPWTTLDTVRDEPSRIRTREEKTWLCSMIFFQGVTCFESTN